MNSKEKGKRGERELAKTLREYGYDCRRGQQFCGANGDADVIGLPGIHIECKRVEHLNIYSAMAQAVSDCPHGKLPVVMHRKNNHQWLVTMKLLHFNLIAEEWNLQHELKENSTLWRKYRFCKINLYDEVIKMSGEFPHGIKALVHGKRTDPLATLWLCDWIKIYTEWEIEYGK